MSLPYLWEQHKHAVKSIVVYLIFILAAFRLDSWIGYVLVATFTMPIIVYIRGTNYGIDILSQTFWVTLVVNVIVFVLIAVYQSEIDDPEIVSLNQLYLSFRSAHFVVTYLISCFIYLFISTMTGGRDEYFSKVYMPSFVTSLIPLGLLILLSS